MERSSFTSAVTNEVVPEHELNLDLTGIADSFNEICQGRSDL